jgi:cellulose synthase/poly-beta-1,6-N-acetylglucosamine synthase-like glycosyltransferase
VPGNGPVHSAPTCSVVICTHNRPEQLEQCLHAVSGLDYPNFNVVVVDSAPDTDSAHQVAAKFDSHYMLEPAEGVSRARNRGARACATEIIAFLDDDAIPQPEWLATLVREFDDPLVMAAGGRIVGSKIESRAEKFFDALGGFDRGLDRRVVDRETPCWFEIANFGGLGGGGNMAFRRQSFDLWRGFHEEFGKGARLMFAEEHHAFFSLISLGYKVVYTPYAVIHHPYPQTVGEIYERQTRRLMAAAGYLTMMFFEEPSYRWPTLKYGFEGVLGRERKWRSQLPMSPFRILSIRRRFAACFYGSFLYCWSRLARMFSVATAGAAPVRLNECGSAATDLHRPPSLKPSPPMPKVMDRRTSNSP